MTRSGSSASPERAIEGRDVSISGLVVRRLDEELVGHLALWRYPVKSMAGESVTTACVGWMGLQEIADGRSSGRGGPAAAPRG